jgi:hypothetical protein
MATVASVPMHKLRKRSASQVQKLVRSFKMDIEAFEAQRISIPQRTGHFIFSESPSDNKGKRKY